MRTENLTENESQIYSELDKQKERIESLETAVQSLEKKLDAILKEMKTFNETNAH